MALKKLNPTLHDSALGISDDLAAQRPAVGQFEEYGLQFEGYGLQLEEYRLQLEEYGLQFEGYGLQPVHKHRNNNGALAPEG